MIKEAIGSTFTSIGYHGYIALLLFIPRKEILNKSFIYQALNEDKSTCYNILVLKMII